MEWNFDMSDAPRDGEPILVFRDNGCGLDYHAVWWSKADPEYPWREENNNAYPLDRFDGWARIKPPRGAG